MGFSVSKLFKSTESKKFDYLYLLSQDVLSGYNNLNSYKFSYEEKDIYNSRIIIYTNVELVDDIAPDKIFSIPSKILYGKLISDPSTKTHIFFSTTLKCIHFTCVIENRNCFDIYKKSELHWITIKYIQEDEDMLFCYLEIINKGKKMYNSYIMIHLVNQDLTNIILDYI
jgi:hypothetical protein